MVAVATMSRGALHDLVAKAVAEARVVDVHTHLYAPEFGSFLLRGIDELLTYHYLVAEALRWIDMPAEEFWRLTQSRQADIVWQTLFIERSPISEACRGVLTVLDRFALDLSSRNLEEYRSFFRNLDTVKHVGMVLELSGVESVVMTNDPFDERECGIWDDLSGRDERFQAALRLDCLLNSWELACHILADKGYEVSPDFGGPTRDEIRRFLRGWVTKVDAMYLAASLPPEFDFPAFSICNRLLTECVLPVAEEAGIPIALMIGVRRMANPSLRPAGDSMGRGSVESVERLCAEYPHNRFMVTMLSRENQHSLAVAARKFRNLMIFGCWWFLNNPSLIEETTRMRLELLGESVIPQHSDARVLDQLIYKWGHSRKVITDVLVEKYSDLEATGWHLSESEIRNDVSRLFSGNFESFAGRKSHRV